MKAATLSITLLILLVGIASAELSATPAQNTAQSNFIFSMIEENTLRANIDVGETAVFLNGEEVISTQRLSAGETLTIPGEAGIYSAQIRSIVDLNYYWDTFKIIENMEPITLDYVSYKRDKKRINFAISGAEFIHPDQVHTTARSVNEDLETYNVVLDSSKVNCYPKITTGKDLMFSCTNAAYPHTLSITATIGIVEERTIELTELAVPIELDEKVIEEQVIEQHEEELQDIPDIDETLFPDEEIEVLDDIILKDTVPVSTGAPSAMQFVIIAGFLAVMVIMFVESHHKYENKQAGKHHPEKKQKKAGVKQNIVQKSVVKKETEAKPAEQTKQKQTAPKQQAEPERKGALAQLAAEQKKR